MKIYFKIFRQESRITKNLDKGVTVEKQKPGDWKQEDESKAVIKRHDKGSSSKVRIKVDQEMKLHV